MKTRNIENKRFGRLTAIKPIDCCSGKNRGIRWLCKCDCGTLILVRTDNLISGHTTKCSLCNDKGQMSVFFEDYEG